MPEFSILRFRIVILNGESEIPNTRSIRALRRERELALRRADVIAAASRVFAEKGFDGAQISEIAALAEVSLTSIYTMFEGKEEIYQAVMSSAAEAVRRAVREQVEAVRDPREQLLCLIDALFSCWEANQPLLQIYARATHGLPWKIREAMGESTMQVFHEFSEWVISIAERAGRAGYLKDLEPRAFAVSLIGSATTMATRWIETTPEQPLTAAAHSVRAIFERLLEQPTSP